MDKVTWKYFNLPKRHFKFEGWIYELNDIMDGHLPAENDKQAKEFLSKLGTFRWLSLYYICTKYNPWNKDISTFAIHDGEWIGENCDGDIDYYKCRNCGEEYCVGH